MGKEYEQLIRERFPNLDYSEFKLIDNSRERLGIDDVAFRNPENGDQVKELVELFIISCKGFTYFYSAEGLGITLNNRLDSILEKLDPEKSILIFPGNGAQTVKQLIRPEIFKFFSWLDLDVRRILSEKMSVNRVDVTTGRNVVRERLPSKLNSCVVIDDVLMSGSTAQSVRSFLDPRDDLEWYAATWMTLSPLQAKPRQAPNIFKSSLPGYISVTTNVLYQGSSGIPANNSLSSFIGDGEKSKIVVDRYREKYVDDLNTFNGILETLRKLKNE
jgi:hypothetical protein